MCATVWRHLVKATEIMQAWQKVMAAYRRVDGSHLGADCLHTWISSCPTLINEYGRTLPLPSTFVYKLLITKASFSATDTHFLIV